MHPPILLFDINGVITTAAPKTDLDSYGIAIKKVFGLEASAYDIEYQGMTSKGIFITLLQGKVSRKKIIANIDRLFRERFEYYIENLTPSELSPLPGIKELLRKLHGRKYVLGALSGVQRTIAEYQLKFLSVLDFFAIGSYGDKYENRIDLFYDAISKAENVLGRRVDKRHVYYFDDSIKGLRAGKKVGVKTVAVATGSHSLDDLMKVGPDFALEDLTDTDLVLNLIK